MKFDRVFVNMGLNKYRSNRQRILATKRFAISFPLLSIICVGILTILSSFYEKNWTYNWNGINPNLKDSIKVAEIRGITSGVGGMGRSTLAEVQRRQWIMSTATKSELQKLTKYPNGTVKAIAYEGLIRKENVHDKADLIIEAINEKDYLISYQMGCAGTRMELGEYLMTFVLEFDRKYYRQSEAKDFGITEKEKEKIIAIYRNENTVANNVYNP